MFSVVPMWRPVRVPAEGTGACLFGNRIGRLQPARPDSSRLPAQTMAPLRARHGAGSGLV